MQADMRQSGRFFAGEHFAWIGDAKGIEGGAEALHDLAFQALGSEFTEEADVLRAARHVGTTSKAVSAASTTNKASPKKRGSEFIRFARFNLEWLKGGQTK